MPTEQYSPRDTLQALRETLDLALQDLDTLLRYDHPRLSPDMPYSKRLERELQAVNDLKWLVYDTECKIALDDLRKLSI